MDRNPMTSILLKELYNIIVSMAAYLLAGQHVGEFSSFYLFIYFICVVKPTIGWKSEIYDTPI